jgi:hypothetical protein
MGGSAGPLVFSRDAPFPFRPVVLVVVLIIIIIVVVLVAEYVPRGASREGNPVVEAGNEGEAGAGR